MSSKKMIDSNQSSDLFASATFFYDGTRDFEQVEAFLSAANNYKSARNIPDSDALQNLPRLLKGDAAVWWTKMKASVCTWSVFETQMRLAFTPNKPAYVIIQEIAATKQLPDERTEYFIAKKRELFNQLPGPEFTETQQLDMIYGSLNCNIQLSIPRESISSFDSLLEAARGVEQLREKPKPKPENRVGKKRIRCNFCRNVGHMADVCRKKLKASLEQIGSSEITSTVKPEPAMTRVTSPSSEPLLAAPDIDKSEVVSSSSPFLLDVRQRPMMEIGIGSAKELAYVDSCANTSVASFKLYSYLKNIGFHFRAENTTITLADGIGRKQQILTGRVPVKLSDRCIVTTFIVLPEARENKTLLGTEFIQDALIVLNLPQLTWHFIDKPDVHYDLIQED